MVHRTITGNCNDHRGSCKTRKWLSFAAFAALAGCAPTDATRLPGPAIVGGWQSADPACGAVQNAARFAVNQLSPGHGAVIEVISAETQVVAGTNIRMVLRLIDDTRWKATVWKQLDGTFALTEAEIIP